MLFTKDAYWTPQPSNIYFWILVMNVSIVGINAVCYFNSQVGAIELCELDPGNTNFTFIPKAPEDPNHDLHHKNNLVGNGSCGRAAQSDFTTCAGSKTTNGSICDSYQHTFKPDRDDNSYQDTSPPALSWRILMILREQITKENLDDGEERDKKATLIYK
nr:hypothetical protein [Tanacetum cinerariifolium]